METRSGGAGRAEGKIHVARRRKRRIQRPLLRMRTTRALCHAMSAPQGQEPRCQHHRNRYSAGHDTTASEECGLGRRGRTGRTAKECVEKANAANAERMRQESAQLGPIEEDFGSPDLVWEALAGCEVKLTMEKLLQLVPRFRRAIEDRITGRPWHKCGHQFYRN